MASYLSLNPDEAYKMGGHYNSETGVNRQKCTTYGERSPWVSNHGLTYRNTTGFSGNTRVMATADVYLSGTPSHTDTVLALGNTYNQAPCGRYAMAGPLIGDSTGGTYEDYFPFRCAAMQGNTYGLTVPNPAAHGEITTQGEFNYGGISFTYHETEQANLQEFPVYNGFPANRGRECPNSINTIVVSNFLELTLEGRTLAEVKGKKFGFVCGNSPDSVAYVANETSYPRNTQHFHVGTGCTFNSFTSATSTPYTKVTFTDPFVGARELIIPTQSAIERVGCNTDGFMVKFKSNATKNNYGYEILPFSATVGGQTYWQIIKVNY